MKIRNCKGTTQSYMNKESNNQFIQTKIKKDFEMLGCLKNPKKQKLLKRLPKKLNIYQYNCKTQAIQRNHNYQLPQINMIKNPLLEMKANELEKSEKIIRNTTKHSRILNEMIQILKDTPLEKLNEEEKKYSKISKINRKKTQFVQNNDNQFIQQSKNAIPVFHRGPKIIHPQFMKICEHNNISRRRIYSEQRSRFSHKPNINKDKINQEDANLLTFYRPFRNNISHLNNEPTAFRNKNIDEQFLIQI